jgi:solute:Na+ symporter, SSS family
MAARIGIIVWYVVMNIAIGWWSARRIRNVGDFFIGGRKIGPWMSAFAFGTTYFSAVVFIGYAGKLGSGFGMHTLWIVAGNALIGAFLSWYVLARRTRTLTARLDAITMPEFLAARYNWIPYRGIAALVVFIFLVPYSASVYQGLGELFAINLGIGYLPAIALMAAITGVYLLMGGYLAVIWTDMFHGILQIFGVVLLVALMAAPLGGIIPSIREGFRPENTPALFAPTAIPGWLTLACLVLITSFGAWGMPQLVQKFYSIRKLEHIKPAMWMSTIFALLMAGGAYFTGGVSRALLGPQITTLGLDKAPDKIVPYLLNMHTPEWFWILVLLLVLSASMSTLASLVLVSSAAISVDLFGFRVKGEGADKRGVLVLRLLCGLFIGISVAIAASQVSFIVNMMAFSWGALAGFFVAPFIYGLFWRKATTTGAVVAGFVGLAIAVLTPILWRFPAPIGGLIPIAKSPVIPLSSALAIVVPLIVLPLVSSFTRKLPAEHVEHVFAPEDEVFEEEPEAEAAAN